MILIDENGGNARDTVRDKQIIKWLEAKRSHVSIYKRLGISKQRFYILLKRLKDEGEIK